MGLVYGYLTYSQRGNRYAPTTSLREIFESVSKGDALRATLGLPSLEDILKTSPELSETALPQLYRETNIVLAQVGKAYLHDNGAYIRAYNKTKHGFVVISEEAIFDPDIEVGLSPPGCWIVVDNPSYVPKPDGRKPMVELYLVEENQVDPMIDRIATIRGAVRTLCELTAFLLEQGLLTSGHGATSV